MRIQMNQRVRCEFLLDDHILRGKTSMYLNHENRRFTIRKSPDSPTRTLIRLH